MGPGPIMSISQPKAGTKMNGIIYLVGLIVIVMAILSWVGMA